MQFAPAWTASAFVPITGNSMALASFVASAAVVRVVTYRVLARVSTRTLATSHDDESRVLHYAKKIQSGLSQSKAKHAQPGNKRSNRRQVASVTVPRSQKESLSQIGLSLNGYGQLGGRVGFWCLPKARDHANPPIPDHRNIYIPGRSNKLRYWDALQNITWPGER